MSTVVGYMGGTGSFPTYQNYTMGNNFSETLRLEFDVQKTSFDDLLKTYWKNVPDPTMDCPDPAYCPRIFYVNNEQKLKAEASLAQHQNVSTSKIILAILPASEYTFWKAEEYHQKYFEKMGEKCDTDRPRNPNSRTRIMRLV
jgi:peptide-methionine (S)-S-oxide reductase